MHEAERELEWRRRELVKIFQYVERSGLEDPHTQEVLARQAVCILYAHIEGFTKAICAQYVTLFRRSPVASDKVSPVHLGLALQAKVSGSEGGVKARLLGEAALALVGRTFVVDNIGSVDSLVNTGSNLDDKRFLRILNGLGIECEPMREYLVPLLRRVPELRHAIAHGDGIPVQRDDYLGLHRRAMGYFDALVDLLSQHCYE